MKKLFGVALGIIASLGGFVDIGDLVFGSQAGAKFGYSLLWALLVGCIGIMIYGEMSGRVAAVARLTVFDIIRRDYPPKLGFITLVLSNIVNLMTCAAEIGGVAYILELLLGFSYTLLVPIVALGLIAIIWFVPFKGIERIFGYVGAGLIVFLLAALKTHPTLGHAIHGLAPHNLGSETLSYWYFAVGLIAATIMPYEIYFYSSGGIEEGWKPKDMLNNRLNATLGFAVGGVAAAGVIIASANLLLPRGIVPEFIGSIPLAALLAFGKIGLLVALLGIMFAIGGSAVETAFSGAYNLSQYAGWRWGRHLPPLKAPKFTWSWLVIFGLGAAVIITGIDPVALTEYAVIFSVVVMPLTYFPIMKMANNKQVMGRYANGRLAKTLGWSYFVVICVVSAVAVPLMLLTGRGQ
jgi:manganese transport protein